MSVKIAATGEGEILYCEGNSDKIYGIASLSKIWAAVLIHDRMKQVAAHRKISVGVLLDELITVPTPYEAMIYHRMEPRPDLHAPDDPLVYQPFREEKIRFRLPVEKGKSYTARVLFEAALFQSKNDAAQALADHFFADDDNRTFRRESTAMAHRLGLTQTKIGDPHGLCDGDNVSTARELITFLAFMIQAGHMEFFGQFDLAGKEHTAQVLFDNDLLAQKGVKLLLAKTASGNNRQGNDFAASLIAVARVHDQWRIAVTLTDEDRFNSIAAMLMRDEPETGKAGFA